MFKIFLFYSLFFVGFSNFYSQDGIRFFNRNIKKVRIDFKLINNLIVIPLKINGKELSFILDTGSNKTIVFNISENETIGLKNLEKL